MVLSAKKQSFDDASIIPNDLPQISIHDENGKDKISRDNSSSLSSLPTPPDGGWAWVVCLGSFLCNVLVDGFMFSFGVFFVDLLDYFKESKGKTAWAGSIVMGMSMFTGPITGSLVNMFGTRSVTIVGAIFASVSFACSTLSPNVNVLIVLYGVFGGIGLSFIFISAVLSVGFYFEKRRAFANGISACGAGVGIFVFAQLSRYLLDTYEWRGALLINSAILLNCAVCGALFRPLTKSSNSMECINSSNDKLLLNEEGEREEEKDDLKVIIKNGKIINNTLDPRTAESYSASMPNIDIYDYRKYSSNHTLDGHLSSSKNIQTQRDVYDSQFVARKAQRMNNPRVRTISTESRGSRSKRTVISSPLYRKDAFYSGSITSLPEFRSNPNLKSFRKNMLKTTSDFEQRQSVWSPKEALRFLSEMCDISLLCNPVFTIIVISCTLWTAQSIVMTYIGDYAMTEGLGKQNAANLLAIIGITNTIGRAVIGWFCDRPFVDCVMVNMAALLIAGCLNIAIPFIKSFELLATVCALYGLCMGTWVSLRPIVLVSLLGIEKLTNAFGWLAMFQGIGFIVGPPCAGFLYDYTKTYVTTFVINGVIFLTSGLLCLPLRRLAAYLHRRKMRKLNAEFEDS